MLFGHGEFFGLMANTDQKTANKMVARCLDARINLFDTAYSFGVSEQMLSKALGDRRKDVVIATKCGVRMGEHPPQARLNSKHIIESAEASAKRLHTDIGQRFGPFDATLMNIGAYSFAWPAVHLNPEEAMTAHRMLRGKALLPTH